jgi:polyhydroxyalkanoate synthesis regulator phasin
MIKIKSLFCGFSILYMSCSSIVLAGSDEEKRANKVKEEIVELEIQIDRLNREYNATPRCLASDPRFDGLIATRRRIKNSIESAEARKQTLQQELANLPVVAPSKQLIDTLNQQISSIENELKRKREQYYSWYNSQPPVWKIRRDGWYRQWADTQVEYKDEIDALEEQLNKIKKQLKKNQD